MSFRYYLYISDTKVSMLLSQIDPGFTRKAGAEVSVGPSFLGLKRTVEPAARDEIGRLERVLRHLEEFGDVGSVEEPGQFFRGQLPMRWGQVPTEAGSTAVFFGGRTERTTVGLGGSPAHVVGNAAGLSPALAPEGAPAADARMTASTLPGLLTALAVDEDAQTGSTRSALASVGQAFGRLRGPSQTVEFLAKRLLHGPARRSRDGRSGNDGQQVLLGSPLYVALVA